MDDSTAEFQYVTGQARPGFAALFAQFEDENLRALWGRTWRLDLPYGAHTRQTFDLCLARDEPIGTVIYFHAGYWQSRDKAQFRFLAPALNDAGYNVAMVNYPLCPDVTLPQLTTCVRDVVAAVSEALPRAQHDVPLIVSGHSAGGHLSIELALSQDTDTPKGKRIAGIVAISGIYDLAPLVQTSLNDKLRLDDSLAQMCSPASRVKQHMPPAVFLVGGTETPEFLRQSREMSGAWSDSGNVSCYWPVDAEDHFSVLSQLRAPDGLFLTALRKLNCP
ncbi:hypothetical protein LMG24238_06710 [Paraburkholderia sediminicola]|uniref:BD-FAE-like domain-containing protein n=1 Tax=Paraburkholderia sediminicola TaxID=458836 RepID=A0A6J5CNK4_9BURK|nr:alpha/beta hydrolase [Paraburkholderia sediminicola]CAB3741049.1 hypothetical protein LMG24238_06710 [Paraburkholderia sediminicola]